MKFPLCISGQAINVKRHIKNKPHNISKKIDKILAKQDQIVNSLAQLKKDIKASPQPQQANKKQPPTADPNKVYNIPIGDSYVKGNRNAPITMIKFTDFQ